LKAEGGESAKVRARRLTKREWLYVIIGLLIGMVVVYFILLLIDQMKLEAGKIDTLNRPKILLDAVVMMLNIAGQVLLSLAFMEQWYIWNLVNVASISLWLVTLMGSGASGYAVVMLIKYVFYLLNSINGLRIWLGLSREK
jgi:nicotinamide mononucleotide transporter